MPHNKPTSSIARPFKIYPNRDFWFENMPSGNPDTYKNIVFFQVFSAQVFYFILQDKAEESQKEEKTPASQIF
jgi:hypothetical protein